MHTGQPPDAVAIISFLFRPPQQRRGTLAAAEALERAMKASEKRAAESAADFERALAKMEARLAEARAEADELRRSAATDAANAKAERERAERLAAEAREKELGELRASVRSVGDGAAVEAATASAELAAAKRRLEDLEQRDGAIIEELRQRLAEKDEECVRLREKRDELVHIVNPKERVFGEGHRAQAEALRRRRPLDHLHLEAVPLEVAEVVDDDKLISGGERCMLVRHAGSTALSYIGCAKLFWTTIH